ncbi:MAG: hypothetical protein ACRDVP_10760 [Acidimicrobiales bacterium]
MSRGFRFIACLLTAFSLGGTLSAVLGTTQSPPAQAAASPLPFQEFVNDGMGGRQWNVYNQSATSGGPDIVGRPSAIPYGLTIHVYTQAANGDLVEFANDGAAGRVWNAYDQTQSSRGPTIVSDPSAVVYGATVHVYAQAPNGHLIEFVNDDAGGRLWNSYDLTYLGGGPVIAGDPVAIVNTPTDRIFARNTSGDLIEYVNDDAGGRLWNSYDLSLTTGLGPVVSDPDPVMVGGDTEVFVVASGGQLMELADTSATGESWSAYDVTRTAPGAQPVTGRPSAVLDGGTLEVFAQGTQGVISELSSSGTPGAAWSSAQVKGAPALSGDPVALVQGSSVHVYCQATQGGALFELASPGPASTFVAADVSTLADGPAIGGDPAPILYGNTIHVYAAASPYIPPPEGVGVYGLSPGAQTLQAIGDGWPIIGDTGALGTTSAPYTGLSLGADLTTGQDIAQSARRVTWMSFWTVSGPVSSGPNATACWSEQCYYGDAFGAGKYVAQTIDSYGSSGLVLKPDWVILDPEGFPDNHSGLDSGPGSSAANWSSFLTGWAAGINSVDPGLHPAFYADQYEYNTFDLASVGLPAFVALAFPGPQDVLSPQGSNISGFVAFGATCPAGPEEQTLTSPPWSGSYNTLQFAGTQYCAP